MTQTQALKEKVTVRVEKAFDSLETVSREVAKQALGVSKELLERAVTTLQKTSLALSDLASRLEKSSQKV